MKLELTDHEAEAVLRAINAGLKNVHLGGLNVMEGATVFIRKVNLARQQEQHEKTLDLAPPSGPDVAAKG